MGAKVNPELLHQHWVHSHEEDTGDRMVFRPSTYDFPLSRGRSSFDLQADGHLIESGIGPTDRSQKATGRWKLEGANRLALYNDRQAPAGPGRVLEIESAEPDRLVVKKDPA